MTGKAKLTAIMLAAVLAVGLVCARPGFAQDAKTDKEKIQYNIAILNNPETTEDAEKQREVAAILLLDTAPKYPEALAALKAALDNATQPEPTPNIVIAVLNALTYKEKPGIPDALVYLVINRLGDANQAISAQAEKALTTATARQSETIYSQMVKLLLNESRPETIRVRVVHIIAESGRSSACGNLLTSLETTGLSESSVVEIVRALGAIGDKQAVPTLIALLEKSAAIRKTAAQSLRRITFYDFGESKAEWDKWWAQNKDKTRAQWQEEFVLALQKDRAEELIADLKAATPDTALNTVMKVFKKPVGNIITPHDRYGTRYAEVIKHTVDAIVNNLKPEDYAQVLPHLEALLVSDDEKIRDAALNYFTKSGVPHNISSIKPLLDCFLNPAESDAIKDRALVGIQISVGASNATQMAPELRGELVAAMEQTVRSGNETRRDLAVYVLGAGLKHVDGLMVLVRLLKFEKAPSDTEADVALRKLIAFTMGPVLGTNGKLHLSDAHKAEIAATLARTFVLDLKVADRFAVPLSFVGYEGEIVVGDLKFAGVSGLLASRLEETVDWGFAQGAEPATVALTIRNIRVGVLKALANIKNGSTEDRIIAALTNPKVIDPNESTLCETALNTLGSVGADKSLEYLLTSGLLGSANDKIKVQAWQSLLDVAQRIYDAGSYEFLVGREKALDDAEAKSKPVSNAKSFCDKTKAIVQDAKKALAETVAKVKALIKYLDPADKGKAEAATGAIEADIQRNKGAIIAALIDALADEANAKPATDAVRAILAKYLVVPEGQDINTMTLEQIKQLAVK